MEKKFTLTSSAFVHQQMIPSQYTCQGENISPALSWQNAPTDTKSFALIVDDPDATHATFVHWIVFNIPADITHLPENDSKKYKTGINHYQNTRYAGPCPPSGVHRYFFKLYALDTLLSLPDGITKEELLNAMENHVLANTELVGLYIKR